MNEERASRRDSILYKLEIRRQSDSSLVGYLGDISREGILVFSHEPFQENDILPVRIILPAEDFSEPFLEITVQIRWSKPDEPRTGQYCSGALIISGKEENSDLIEKLMEEYGFQRM